MDKHLDGRVVVVTGAGRGLGAAYALALAAQGAKVVVNDLGRGLHGELESADPAQLVVEQIRAAGSEAVADGSDVAEPDGAERLIQTAIENFGDLHILINNAGILRDRMLVNMTVDDWDAVIRVHLRGHFNTTQRAASYWRERAKTSPDDRVLIQTSSISGLHGAPGQTNYAVAKSGIAMMAHLNHLELNSRYGVRAYALAPGARTRLTLNSPAAADNVVQPEDGRFDYWAPDNVAKFVTWLCAAGCSAPSGTIYGAEGDVVRRYNGWTVANTIRNGGQEWTFDALNAQAGDLIAGHERSFTPISEVLGGAQ